MKKCILVVSAWFYRLFHAYVAMQLGNLSAVELTLNTLGDVQHPLIDLVGRFMEDEDQESDVSVVVIHKDTFRDILPGALNIEHRYPAA